MTRNHVAIFAFAFATVAAPGAAHAWVRTLTCDDHGGDGYPCDPDEVPKPVFWPDACATFAINEAGTADIEDFDLVVSELIASFEAWNDLDCNYLRMRYEGLTPDGAGLTPDGFANGNVIIFYDDFWPHPAGIHALTSVSYDPVTAYIADADMEINAAGRMLGVIGEGEDRPNITDLRNVITHEAGHFLGLEHSSVLEATMYPSSPNGDLSLRSLESDDIEAACMAYPVERNTGGAACDCVDNGDGTFGAPAADCVDNTWRVDERASNEFGDDAGDDAGAADVGVDTGTGSGGGTTKGCAAGGSGVPGVFASIAVALLGARRRRGLPAP